MLKKLYGGLDLTWKKLIIWAVVAGVYTGVMAVLPFTKDTSLRDITTTFECWIVFGTIIIVNSKSKLDSALKCIVFFLISQPLVYLVEVPFVIDGWGIFRYYPEWFRWTLLTFPMGYFGYLLKDNKWYGILILTPVLLFSGSHYTSYLGEAIYFFPTHLLTTLLCLFYILSASWFIFDNEKIRKIQMAIAVVIVVGFTVFGVINEKAYDTSFFLEGVTLDENTKATMEDERYGTFFISKEATLDEYILNAHFTKLGTTEFTVETSDGKVYRYRIKIQRDTYDLERIN